MLRSLARCYSSAARSYPLQSIFRYPIKSCKGEQIEQAAVSAGCPLPGDRQFMFVDAEGRFLTQRPSERNQGNKGSGIPQLVLIEPSVDGRMLRVEAPGMEPVSRAIIETTEPDAR